MFVTNGGVWKTDVCSLVICFNGGACGRTDMPLTLSTIGGVVLLEIVVSCWFCMDSFCVNTVAEDIDPSAIGLHDLLIGAVVIEPSCYGASLVTGVKMGMVISSNDIIGLMGLVGVPPAPPVSPVVIFRC
ncbi:unnamed protein product [Lactuca virosa]|uniref:Uncharacterized protein n=1 Tax=Lactuca virosa TaxID=75947 RepID=A0AAU9LI44_9ASTR|nr:unnamed protein product [Lactuca virosa]